MKTKISIFLAMCGCLLLGYPSVDAFSIHIESDDVQSGWKKIKESRFPKAAGNFLDDVWSELTNFVSNGLQDISNQQIISSHREQISSVKLQKPVLYYAPGEDKEYFSDIAFDTHKNEINVLARRKIIDSGSQKFYPHNLIRLHECVKVLLKSCEQKLGKKFVENNVSLLNTAPEHYQLADSIGLLKGIANIKDFERFISAQEYSILLKNISEWYPTISIEKVPTWETISRSEMAAMIVQIFGLNDEFVSDDTVSVLITHNMYPFSDVKTGTVSRLGFAQFLAQVYASKNGEDLSVNLVNKKYIDVNYSQHPYMYFLQKKGFIDYLSESRRGNTYFYPSDEITMHEVYYILTKTFGYYFNYNIADADEKTITYDELSAFFVEILFSTSTSNETNALDETHSSEKVENNELDGDGFLSELFSLFE